MSRGGRPRVRGPGLAAVLLLGLLPGLLAGVRASTAPPLPADLPEAVARLGPPGVLWGRLAFEEESPAGTTTPLPAVEVTLYVATQQLVTELEHLRQGARSSWSAYESTVERVRAVLATHQTRAYALRSGVPLALDLSAAARRQPPSPGDTGSGAPGGGGRPTVTPPSTPPEPPPLRRHTDQGGLFVFDAVPGGQWLVVAVHAAPYGPTRMRAEPRPRAPTRARRFLAPTREPWSEVEMWVVPVWVVPGERTGLTLTDRARWLVGPGR